MRVHGIFAFSALALTVLATACTEGTAITDSRSQGLTYYDYNVDCADLGFPEELKIDQSELTPGVWTDYQDGEMIVSVYTADGKHFDWSSNLGIDAAIAKGGDGANVYEYSPESMGDQGLVTPDNSSGGPAQISHISFCFDYELIVSKSADTSYRRTFSWNINKEAEADPSLLLALGQSYLMPYSVAVWSSSEDDNWAVSGSITIYNPSSQLDGEIASVSDMISGGISVPVDCGVSFPYVLGPQQSLQCSYSSPLPDGSDRVNEAVVAVTAQSGLDGGSGSADVMFGEPSEVVDECVTVDDDKAGLLGYTCMNHTFSYSIHIGPYEQCGQHEFSNTAEFTTNDSGAKGSDSVIVDIEVPCPPDTCSLTPGYWKTHSEYGPAPYDDTWAMLADGADTLFFMSGMSYYDVLWTQPRGNAYYILAHAFIAAELNGLNGAELSAVSSEYADAMAYLQAHTPAHADALKGKARNDLIDLASVLDDFNNGIVGPGHCSE